MEEFSVGSSLSSHPTIHRRNVNSFLILGPFPVDVNVGSSDLVVNANNEDTAVGSGNDFAELRLSLGRIKGVLHSLNQLVKGPTRFRWPLRNPHGRRLATQPLWLQWFKQEPEVQTSVVLEACRCGAPVYGAYHVAVPENLVFGPLDCKLCHNNTEVFSFIEI